MNLGKMKRSLIGSAVAALLLSGLLAGCGGGTEKEAKDGPADPPNASAAAQEVRFSIVSARPGDEDFYKGQMKIFMQKNPEVKVSVVANPTEQYNNALQLSFAANEGPDLFFIEGGQPQARAAYDNGWIEPLDGYVDEAFQQRFPKGAFGEASQTRINGKIVGVPVRDPRFDKVRPLYYNKSVLQQFGYDEPPKTYSQFVEMATRITEEGKGKVYGFAMMGKAPAVFGLNVSGLGSSLDGSVIGYEGNTMVNLKTGQFSSVSAVPIVEMLRQLNANKVVAPGWESWDTAQMHQQFAAGRVAMFIGAAWQAEEIRKLNEGMDMGISAAPVPDKGRNGYRDTPTVAEPRYAMSSQSKVKDAAWKVLDFLGSSEFERANYEYAKELTLMPEAMEGVELSEDMRQIVQVMDETIRTTPAINTNNPNYDKFSKKISDSMPKPKIQEVFLKAVIENEDPMPLAEAYDAKANQVIDEQIKIANDDGIQFERADMTYPDWDPMQDYAVR